LNFEPLARSGCRRVPWRRSCNAFAALASWGARHENACGVHRARSDI
jgi:hypothetical protein